MKSKKGFIITAVVVAFGTASLVGYKMIAGGPAATTDAKPVDVEADDTADKMTMAKVLDMARAAREHMATSLDDYTARFVKQEVDASGKLAEESEMVMKVQTRLRNESDDAPMRVYLKFNSPESVAGREVIWAADLHDGQMAVHETTFLLNLKTIWLDPNGVIAMQGQRYPISEIGLVKLVEKLIERGQEDIDDPDVTVSLTEGHSIGDTATQLIQVRRAKPSEREDDFSLAEISIDPERQLILQFRSFGWPESEGAEPPLIESYTYHDVKTNVGLSEQDFDPTNSEYGFP